jgi:hypothetical protein
MILLAGIVTGLIAAIIRAWITKRKLQVPILRYAWLVILAFAPQFLAFQFRSSADLIPDRWIPILLVTSQLFLVVFITCNLQAHPSIWLLGVGLFLNLVVILGNKGMMPITPEMVTKLFPDAPSGSWTTGERLARSKDIVLPFETTRLWHLSDIFKVPDWLHSPTAFSLGDIFIALGAFFLLFFMTGKPGLTTTNGV